MLTHATGAPLEAHHPLVQVDGHLSYGQSWRSNGFYSFDSFGLNENGPLAFQVSSIGAFLGPGPMPGSAGISLTSLPVETTNYQGNDYFMVGRCAVLAQQLLRIRDGVKSLPSVLEFCTAFPGSTWNSGLGGGLAPGSTFIASISGTTLTVSYVDSGYVSGGQLVVAGGVHPMTRIYANLSSTRSVQQAEHLLLDNDDGLEVQQLDPGGSGTYQLNLNFTSLDAVFSGTGPSASLLRRLPTAG
jgi:hypothetical protein